MEHQIKVLQQQIAKLNDPKFDLEAWKMATSVLLSRIFGRHDTKSKLVEDIRFDYGSWSLRDADGSDHAALGKKRATEILEAAILELETLGQPIVLSSDSNADPAGEQLNLDDLMTVIENELSVSQFRQLGKLLQSAAPDKQVEVLVNQLQIFGSPVAFSIVANLLLLPSVKTRLFSEVK